MGPSDVPITWIMPDPGHPGFWNTLLLARLCERFRHVRIEVNMPVRIGMTRGDSAFFHPLDLRPDFRFDLICVDTAPPKASPEAFVTKELSIIAYEARDPVF